METQHKVKDSLSLRGKWDHSCARAFYFESNRGIENAFEKCTHVNGGEKIHAIEILIK